jgi:RNA polymerase sigma factor (sigma-70 family)
LQKSRRAGIAPFVTPQSNDERSLVQSAMDGDERAFERLHSSLGDGLRRFLATKVAAAQVDELAQETWLDAYRALRSGRYDPERASFSTFLYAVAWRVVLRHRRAQASGLQVGAEAMIRRVEDILGSAPGTDEVVWLSSLLQDLRRCLRGGGQEEGLSATDRELVRALFYEQATERAIAARLGLAPSTVHARRQRILSALARCLEGRGHQDIQF